MVIRVLTPRFVNIRPALPRRTPWRREGVGGRDVMIEIHASLHKFEGQDQSGPYARPMIVTKRAATASAAATE